MEISRAAERHQDASQLMLAQNNALASQDVLSLNTYWLRPADLWIPRA